MKVVIAPDAYKESLSAIQVANVIEKGFKRVFPDAEYVKVPMADGGEGTVETMVAATKGKLITVDVVGPLGEVVPSAWGISGDEKTAFIEIASACGLERVPLAKRNPLITTTYGVGQLILSALDYGITHFIIGLGGSATNDAGAGMLQALGVKLLDHDNQQIGYGGAELARLAKIDLSALDKRLADCQFEIACDVTNPLIGECGASVIFGPQKGATPPMVKQLDLALMHFAEMIKRDLDLAVADMPGAGAAGGLGAAFAAFLHGNLKSGIKIIGELLALEQKVADADLVITGEGRIDHQSINGKVPVGVAAVAKQYGVPVIGIAGALGKDIEIVQDYGIDAVFSVLNKVSTFAEAMRDAELNLAITAYNVAKIINMQLPTSLKMIKGGL